MRRRNTSMQISVSYSTAVGTENSTAPPSSSVSLNGREVKALFLNENIRLVRQFMWSNQKVNATRLLLAALQTVQVLAGVSAHQSEAASFIPATNGHNSH